MFQRDETPSLFPPPHRLRRSRSRPTSNRRPPAIRGRPASWAAAFSNLLLAVTDWQVTIAETNDVDRQPGHSLRIHQGRGPFLRPHGHGPVRHRPPRRSRLNKGKYTPILRDDVRWINSGYSEFPPELGWESRYNYVR